MLRLLRSVALATLLIPAVALAQGASESLEREARSAFKAGKFRDAALKFQDAAAASADATRTSRMELQAAWSHYNDKNQKASREALRRSFAADPQIEIVPEFFSPEFLRIVEETKLAAVAAPKLSPADLAELKRVSAEKLADGRASEVVYDLTNLAPEQLDSEAWTLLARAYDAVGRADAAAQARRAAAGEPGTRTLPPSPTAPPAAGSPRGTDPAETLASGRAALVRGDAFTAQSMANRALELDPTSSEAYRLLGDAYAARGDKALAEANWRQSLRLNERNEATLLALGDFYVAEKSWPAALESLKKAAELNPANGQKLVALARSSRSAGDLVQARTIYAVAAQALPGDVPVLAEYASMLLYAGDVDAALEPLMRAAGLEPDRAVVRANLAAAFRRKKQNREAEREYREALRADEKYVPALLGLGALLLGEDRPKDAEPLYAKAAAVEPSRVEAQIGLARARRLGGDLVGALEALGKAAESDDPALLNEAGALAYDRKQFAEARALFEKAAAKDPALEAAKQNLEKARAAAELLEATAAPPPAAPAPARP